MNNNSYRAFLATKDMRGKTAYGFFLLVSIFFWGLFLYTVLRTLTYFSLTLPFPAFSYFAIFIICLYLVALGILGYGFFTLKKWTASVLATHLGITLITALVYMPLTHHQDMIKTTIISSLLYWVFLAVVIANLPRLHGKLIRLPFIVAYIVCMGLFVFLRLHTF